MSKSQSQFSAQRHELGDNSAHKPPEAIFEIGHEGGQVQLSHKYDAWSVGAMMHDLLLDAPHRLKHPTWPSVTEKNTLEFGQDPNNRIFPNPNTPLERLLNQLMHPDPQQRMGMSEALKDPFFDDLFENPNERGSVKPSVQTLLLGQLNA